ncbi:MAG: SUMF1/EgtB/PvdO family nonheme iron enzyme [bacterium]
MIKKTSLKRQFLLGLLLMFSAVSALGWDGGETRMEEFAGRVGRFVERVRANYTANSAVRGEIVGLIDKYSREGCSSDFFGFASALDELAAKAEEEESMNPDAIDELRRLYEDELSIGCPKDMVLIEGVFCIDKHEYPGNIGSPPQGGFSWNEAVAKCIERGKYLCSGDEWRRACRGNPACSDTSFSEDFDKEKCGVFPKYVAPGADWKLTGRPECESAYGVNDLAGGLWEWTRDDYRPGLKVLRTGASPKDPAPTCDETMWAEPGARMEYAGFRCCAATITLPEEEEQPPEDATGTATGTAAVEEPPPAEAATGAAAGDTKPEPATGTATGTASGTAEIPEVQ